VHGAGETGVDERKRPQSVDNPYFPGGDHSISSSITSDCDDTSQRILHMQWDGPHWRKRLEAKLPLLGENVHNCVDQDRPSDIQTVGNNVTGQCLYHT
jgi:hypothetical protein